jgi:hypothetical protein
MSKIKKAVLLFLIALIFMIISIFDLTLGTINLTVSLLRLPFKLVSQWLIDKADKLNIK